MLKYRINTSNIKNDNELIVVSKSNFIDYNRYNIITKENTLKTVVCYSNNIKNLKVGTKITTHNNITLSNIIDINDTTTIGFINNFEIKMVDISNGSFSFTIPKFKHLSISNMMEEGDYTYIYFNDYHFFQKDYEENDLNNLWFLYDNEFKSNKDYKIDYEIVSNNSIRFNKTEFEVSLKDIDINSINLYRENYLFTDIDHFNIYFINPKCIIPIGLTNTNQINLLKEQGLIDYVNKTKEESINSIVDMEKDVYTPVYYDGDDNENKYKNIIGIKFNLHFRERNLNDGKWLTETVSLWNGIDGEDFNNNYFSYDDKDKQSDLLSYLGFTDNDVRYQKSKLKKSFLRISFYDSMNMGNQNLLAYSTIYMDGGEYFSKYIRHINDEIYHKSGEESQDKPPLKGIRVNREPCGINDNDLEEYRLSSQIKVFDKYNSNSSSEGFYLYLYKDLFAPTDDNPTLTLYAKVEFNHAGYGRTVPFMMPYWDKNKWNDEIRNEVTYEKREKVIKSFEDIRKDWLSKHIIDKDKDTNNIVKDYWQFEGTENEITDGQYGAKQYTKFSYIRFKIRYDENQKRYIYYLDDETYGNIDYNIENDNILLLNLYEANMI